MGLSSPDLAPWVSDAARVRFETSVANSSTPVADADGLRRHYAGCNQARLDVALQSYDVEIETASLGGVVVHHVRPRIAAAGESRRLICLHGGAFMWGEGPGALIEAVPVAATSGIPVVAVEYRMAPEHRFPAATDDVLSIYHAMCRDHAPASLGIYGCSAGAVLSAQSVAAIVAEGGPVPGAIAMLHAAGLELAGDTVATNAALNGLSEDNAAMAMRLGSLDYLSQADPSDPLVFPGNHPATLAKFPPSLLVTGTRDFAGSSISVMHRRLIAAGATSDFVLFDGMWHAHHVDTDLPEAQETFALLARFFHAHLGA